MDKAVAEATETRKAENAEYKDTMASDGAAKELIGVAKNRLNKFYNPKLHKAAPKQELSAQDRARAKGGEAYASMRARGVSGEAKTLDRPKGT